VSFIAKGEIMPIQTQNPATEEVIKIFEPLSSKDIEEKIAKAHETYKKHRQTSYVERAKKLLKIADILEKNKESYAQIMTTEMGKTLKSSISEVEKCASLCRFYAENGEKFLKDRHIKTENEYSYVTYKPIGIILAVMPWNFPFWQVFRFIVPNLMAGNVGLLKHASNVPQCALKIEEIIKKAGFDEGCFQTLLIESDAIENIVGDERIRGVTLTGSEKAGQIVASQAGKVCKKTVLELGGSDAFIVMPSADLDEALNKGKTGRTMNNGQSCIAAKRFIVHEDIYDEFKSRFIDIFENLKVGDPTDDQTDIGPLSMQQTRDDLDELVEKSVKAGATKLCGAHKIDAKGYFYQPGILENIPENAPAYTEELFGPVALLFKVKDIDEAIDLANTVRFGLGSAIFTNDEAEINKAVQNLDAGSTFINSFTASDPKLPFGGVKNSGYGRELAEEGIREFCNIKTIVKAK
jgi:succinate-semialdehyde dehydrogenase/glutarate-semialdehyde dehydrogenase